MALPFHKLLQTLSSGSSIGSAAVAILASYGTDAHIYLPGIGALNGYTLGNWLDSGGTTPATVDNPVGLVQDAIGTIHVSQGTTANKPILRKPSNNYYWEFDGVNDSLASTSAPFQISDDHCVVMGVSRNAVSAEAYPFVVATTGTWNYLAATFAFTAGGGVRAYWRDGAVVLVTAAAPGGYSAGIPIVVSARKIGNNKVCRLNGSPGSTESTVMASPVVMDRVIFSNYSTSFFDGSIYPIIAIKGTISDANLLILERWVGSLTGPTGVVIP